MTSTTTTPPAPEQLSLLPPASVPVRFRLDEETRRRGLRHIAEIRAHLAAPHRPERERSDRTAELRRPAA